MAIKSLGYIEKEETKAQIIIANCIEKYNYDKASDFERFRLACSFIFLSPGNDIARELSRFVGEDLDEDISKIDFSNSEEQKRMWRKMNGAQDGKDDKISVEKNNIISNYSCNSKEDYIKNIVEKYNLSKNDERFLNFKNYIENQNGNKYNSIEDMSIALSAELAASASPSIASDCSSLVFCRPDPHSSEGAYKKYISGEKCNIEDASSVLLWLLCRTLTHLGEEDRNRVWLSVKIGDNTEFLKKLLDLLDLRKLYINVSVSLDVPSLNIISALPAIYTSYKQKNISSEIIITEEMNDAYIRLLLRDVFYHLPASTLYYSKAFSSSGSDRRFEEIYLGLALALGVNDSGFEYFARYRGLSHQYRRKEQYTADIFKERERKLDDLLTV